MPLNTVAVYCASSERVHTDYFAAARQTGALFAQAGVEIVYGGGGSGLMGALADGAMAEGGRVTGVLPEFMMEVEWGHSAITELRVVPDMHTRTRTFLELADAFVALPGGCGTFEELFQALTWKRLGLHSGPVALLNTRAYFDPCVRLLEQSIEEGFMEDHHLAMWCVANTPDELLPALRRMPTWRARIG
jgi:uncharacterized protein (TIGR00730 family)